MGWIVFLCSAGCRQLSIKDFIVDDGNCLQSREVLVSVEIPYTDEVRELNCVIRATPGRLAQWSCKIIVR